MFLPVGDQHIKPAYAQVAFSLLQHGVDCRNLFAAFYKYLIIKILESSMSSL
jgi:hypothetical protein